MIQTKKDQKKISIRGAKLVGNCKYRKLRRKPLHRLKKHIKQKLVIILIDLNKYRIKDKMI